MIVDEKLLKDLQSSVSNSQYRLSDVHVLSILEQLIPAIEELKEKINIIEDSLSSDEDKKEVTIAVEEKITEPKIDTVDAKEDVASKEVKAKSKAKE